MSFLDDEFETKTFVWPVQKEAVEQHLRDGWTLRSREPVPPGDGPPREEWVLREPPKPPRASRRRSGGE